MNPTPTGLSGAYAALHTIEFPEFWSPEQALAVWVLLNEMADRIRACHEVELVELIRVDLEHEHHDNQLDLFDPDDTIPF